MPEVHQTVDAERDLRRMLGEADTWGKVAEFAATLRQTADAGENDSTLLTGTTQDRAHGLVQTARMASDVLLQAYRAMAAGDLDALREQSFEEITVRIPSLAAVPSELRSRNHRAALSLTNALAEVRRATRLFHEYTQAPSVQMVAVLADAGSGKTQLAAQLTAESSSRPAGVLLHGRDLYAAQTLDDLARRITIQGRPVPTMDALIAALDSAAERAARRLPIVIDGLNEAEDIRKWKGLLASLEVRLANHPYILVVCTLRTEFADDILPAGFARLSIPDFDGDQLEAVRKYFRYFKIDAADAELPWELLSHPLTLRLFCEVTNPRRDRPRGVESMPGSLTNLFDRYVDQVCDRAAHLAPRSNQYYAQDVRIALRKIGLTLWQDKDRSLDRDALRVLMNDQHRSWEASIVRALEHEGVLLRVPGNTNSFDRVGVVYDALAGYLVADALLHERAPQQLASWLQDASTEAAFGHNYDSRQPLAEDIFQSLAGILPRRHHLQLWQLVNDPLRGSALYHASKLEGQYLDAETVEQLGRTVTFPPSNLVRDLFGGLRRTRGSIHHPLNVNFLHSVLKPMTIADRDLRWSEWLRRNHENATEDIRRLESQWKAGGRPAEDKLRAHWVLWTLTTTVQKLRDHATRALYWYGRQNPGGLFDLTLESLTLNDPSISERMLAASFGVLMANQREEPELRRALPGYLEGLKDALIGPGATYPTDHWLARLYVQGTVECAAKYYPDIVAHEMSPGEQLPFASGPVTPPMEPSRPEAKDVEDALHLDFEDDALGRLLGNRYSGDGRDQAQIAHIRRVVWDCGWRSARFEKIDREIDSYGYRRNGRPADRYGRKYGWIGFYTLPDSDELEELKNGERPAEVQIDPSFPDPAPAAPFTVAPWARQSPRDDRRWIQKGNIEVQDDLLYRDTIGDCRGPWILVAGSLRSETAPPIRQVWGAITALIVRPTAVDLLLDELAAKPYPGNHWLPQIPDDYYTFAGEIPWSSAFAIGDDGTDHRSYNSVIGLSGNRSVEAEILAHDYAWESYHSRLNNAGGALVPSHSFSARFDLRGTPQSFNQVQRDGSIAAISLAAPDGFRGRLLYLRVDLVKHYLSGRKLIWFSWGERQVDTRHYQERSEWLVSLLRKHAHVWRDIRRGDQLVPTLRSKRSRKLK
jgi:hypothetical protein